MADKSEAAFSPIRAFIKKVIAGHGDATQELTKSRKRDVPDLILTQALKERADSYGSTTLEDDEKLLTELQKRLPSSRKTMAVKVRLREKQILAAVLSFLDSGEDEPATKRPKV